MSVLIAVLPAGLPITCLGWYDMFSTQGIVYFLYIMEDVQSLPDTG